MSASENRAYVRNLVRRRGWTADIEAQALVRISKMDYVGKHRQEAAVNTQVNPSESVNSDLERRLGPGAVLNYDARLTCDGCPAMAKYKVIIYTAERKVHDLLLCGHHGKVYEHSLQRKLAASRVGQ